VIPETGRWFYNNVSSGHPNYCILNQMAIKMQFMYDDGDQLEEDLFYDVPANATNFEGSFCADFDVDSQRLYDRLRITFFEDDPNEPEPWILELDFLYDYDPLDGDREWYIGDVDLYYNYNNYNFPGMCQAAGQPANCTYGRQQARLDRVYLFYSDLRESYKCDSHLTTEGYKFQFIVDGNDPKIPRPASLTMHVWNTQIEAFARQAKPEFHAPFRCYEDQYIPRLVPGIIGGIVGAVVIFVVAVYVGQRKAMGRNYNSPMEDDNTSDSSSNAS
jgi:hypothetical protein